MYNIIYYIYFGIAGHFERDTTIWWFTPGSSVIASQLGATTLWSTMVNHGKSMGKPWENGDSYGKIHHFE